MMTLYYILCTISVIFTILAILTSIFLASGDELMLIPIIAYIIMGLSIWGQSAIEAKYDVVTTEIVQARVTKLDITERYYKASVVNDEREFSEVVSIDKETYVTTNVGDVVSIKVTTVTNTLHNSVKTTCEISER